MLDVLHKPRLPTNRRRRYDEGRYRAQFAPWPLTAHAPNGVLGLYSRFVVAWRVCRENRSGLQIGRLGV